MKALETYPRNFAGPSDSDEIDEAVEYAHVKDGVTKKRGTLSKSEWEAACNYQ